MCVRVPAYAHHSLVHLLCFLAGVSLAMVFSASGVFGTEPWHLHYCHTPTPDILLGVCCVCWGSSLSPPLLRSCCTSFSGSGCEKHTRGFETLTLHHRVSNNWYKVLFPQYLRHIDTGPKGKSRSGPCQHHVETQLWNFCFSVHSCTVCQLKVLVPRRRTFLSGSIELRGMTVFWSLVIVQGGQ